MWGSDVLDMSNVTSSASSSFFFLLSGMRSSNQLNSLLVKMQSISFLINTRAKTSRNDTRLIISIIVTCVTVLQMEKLAGTHVPSWERRWQLERSWWARAESDSWAGWWWRGVPSSEVRVGDRWSLAGAWLACRKVSDGQRTREEIQHKHRMIMTCFNHVGATET